MCMYTVGQQARRAVTQPVTPASRNPSVQHNLGPLGTPDAVGDDARDGWTFSIITPDGLAAIQPDSLHFAVLNLAEKSERHIGFHLKETHQRYHFSCGCWTLLNGEVLSC